MQACWNKLALDRPPTTSWRCTTNEFDSKGFLKIVDNAILELESQETFQIEAAVLSRLIYRMKSKLRSDKGLKNMEKVNRALLNYRILSLEKDYKYLRENVEAEGDIQGLPSRQMLQYALARTQGFAKLMCRIENVARLAADFFKTRISLGQAWNISVVAYAVVSRIWLLSRYLTKKSCEWYNKLYKYLSKLKIVGVSWISESYKFPNDLNSWLSVSWINEDLKNFSTKSGLPESIFNLIKQNPDTVLDDDIEIEKPALPIAKSVGLKPAMEESDIKEIESRSHVDKVSIPRDEVGERISREIFTTERSKKTSKTPSRKRNFLRQEDKNADVDEPLEKVTRIEEKMSKHRKVINVKDIKTKEDIVKLVNFEKYPGMDKLQWKIVKKNVRKLLLKLNEFDDNSTTKKRDLFLKKVIQAIREWIT